jgi:hypothetical protein
MRLTRILATAALAIGTSLTVSTASARVDIGITVGTPPPPPQVVGGPIGVAPTPGYVWTNGYWDWNGGRWIWVGGRWAAPPYGHRVWVEPYYHPYRAHYHYHRGHWR